jgi:hypothetical protein
LPEKIQSPTTQHTPEFGESQLLFPEGKKFFLQFPNFSSQEGDFSEDLFLRHG